MNSRSHGKDQESWPVDHLMQHGIQASGNMQFDVAEKFFRRVLQQDPTHLGAIDALAEVKIQCGEIDEAVELLLHSTSADPYSNPFKWFSLAQLRQGNDSVSTYKSGITVLTELLTKESTQVRCNIHADAFQI